ncbi:MAG: menaquinone biosynthesis protein [Candidatus Sumerlaeia bacterium]|nr:menaquinone biosynthesis protein [Candidatus Sumerlaeia bacterium]
MAQQEIRLGIVPYLNVLPLLEGLDLSIPRENWHYGVPRELAALLGERRVDFATMPIFEVLRAGGNYKLLGKCSISCDGPVRSVRLFSHKPLKEARHVLLDRSSLTSAHLAMILCREYLQISPRFTTSELPIGFDFDLASTNYDAVLVIGDVALGWMDSFPHELDLGAAWKELTGLPFVFAGWACWKDQPIPRGLQELFVGARKLGERQVYEIAKRHAHQPHQTPPPHIQTSGNLKTAQRELRDLVEYLSLALRYNLRDTQRQGIELYRRKLIEHKLLPENTPPIQIESPIEDERKLH